MILTCTVVNSVFVQPQISILKLLKTQAICGDEVFKEVIKFKSGDRVRP